MMVFQAERAAYTLRRLTKVAEQITAGDLSARTLSISGGEVGQFVRAFNRMADKLQAQMAKRAREKDRLHTVLHTMTDGVLLLNRHNYVRLLNDAAAQILHISAERALKRSFTQTVRDHRFVEVFTRCQQSGTTESAILELEPDVVIRMVVTPFLRGKDRGHLVVLQNLSRMHQLQMARRDFVSNISHELRTPLASLRALVETLSDGAIDDKVAAQRFLHHMEVEVDALTQMVQELLELSRIESGNAKLELASVSAATLLNQSSDRLRAQAERAEITLLVDAAETLPAVRVDVGRMQQVITNLIHNAIKFTQSGGTITISAKLSRADKITVAVRDSGVGIAHDDLPRIFERFYKADRARAGGGTGLGLAIAKHIVQAHGGTIWAESTPGKGSTFYFTLCTASSSATTSTTDSLTQ
ncbi:MAG: ATP-binding protein [Caldilineaceae bacterium]